MNKDKKNDDFLECMLEFLSDFQELTEEELSAELELHGVDVAQLEEKVIQIVQKGGIYLSPRITGVLVDDYVQRLEKGYQQQAPELTTREREVLQLLTEGKSTKQIALQLHVSTKTIESNRRNIMDKLDMHSVAELTKYAIREGLTPLES